MKKIKIYMIRILKILNLSRNLNTNTKFLNQIQGKTLLQNYQVLHLFNNQFLIKIMKIGMIDK
jgi:hypothetical protein